MAARYTCPGLRLLWWGGPAAAGQITCSAARDVVRYDCGIPTYSLAVHQLTNLGVECAAAASCVPQWFGAAGVADGALAACCRCVSQLRGVG